MPASFVRPRILRVAAVLAACAAACPAPAQQATAPASQLAGKPKVIVIPIKGPLYYQMAVPEINKIVRGAIVQKPDAVVFVISSPDGNRNVAFAIAELIAELPARNIVAYVSGDHSGVFGPAVIPLFACNRIFVAPQNTLDLRSAIAGADDPADPTQTRLTPRQVSLLQSWAAQHRLSWSPIKVWLDSAAMLASDDTGEAPAPASQPASQPAAVAQLGLRALHASPAADLDEVLAQLDLAGAWVITWPDPIAKSNEQMQHIFETADSLVKQTNAAIGAARELDPRAFRYELRDISRQYTTRTISGASQPTDPRWVSEQTNTVTDHNLFADGGQAWRIHTDRCIAQVRKAIESNRNLAKLATLYPEVNVDAKELNESYQTLAGWLNQLRSERNLRSPP